MTHRVEFRITGHIAIHDNPQLSPSGSRKAARTIAAELLEHALEGVDANVIESKHYILTIEDAP